jgi:hypothetical protein
LQKPAARIEPTSTFATLNKTRHVDDVGDVSFTVILRIRIIGFECAPSCEIDRALR